MPAYEYRCSDCGHEFTVALRISEHDTYKPQCPQCKSQKVEQLLSHFFAKTAKKS